MRFVNPNYKDETGSTRLAHHMHQVLYYTNFKTTTKSKLQKVQAHVIL